MSSTTQGGPTEQHNSNPATAATNGGDTTANPLTRAPRHASALNTDALHAQREVLQEQMAALVTNVVEMVESQTR